MIVWNPKDGPPRLRIPEPPADHAAAEREAEFILRQDDAPMTWVQLARAYRELQQERDSLRERLAANSGWAEDADLAALREDKARLDWLDDNGGPMIGYWQENGQDVWCVSVDVLDPAAESKDVTYRATTLRAALDAARASQQEGRDD